jgi:anti-sigma factor RsiW
MTLPDVHLAGEAVAAYVDGALSPTARDRAERHLHSCAECRAVIDAQREAKVLLAAALDPEMPTSLLTRLRDIPMTADLGGSDIVYAIDGEELAWTRVPASPVSPDVRFYGQVSPLPLPAPARSASAAAPASSWPQSGPPVIPPDTAGYRPSAASRRDVGERGGRPRSYPSARRRSRRLAGALAGLAFGMIASAASTGTSGTALPEQRGGSTANSPPLVINRGSVPGPLNAGTLNVGVPLQRGAAVLNLSGPKR